MVASGYGSGYGYGSGDGDGSGDGSGYGYGDGYGYGSGDGDGYGYGYGYGYGDGYGYGYGEGYGYGSGSGYGAKSQNLSGGSGYGGGYGGGSGDGSGYGSGSNDYWMATIQSYVQRSGTAKYVAQLQGATIALWRSDSEGKPCNGGSGQPATVGLRDKITGPLAICTRQALHATYQPHRYDGNRLWLVALFGELQERDDKLAALEREIIAEVV